MKLSLLTLKQYFIEIRQVLTGKDSSDHVTRHLIKGTSGTFILNITNNLLLFLISIILSRILGAEGYGIYIYALTWSLVLAMPASIGMNRILIRNIADYHAKSEWNYLSGQIKWSDRAVLIASLVTSAVGIIAIILIKSTTNINEIYVLCIAMVMLPFMTLMRLRQAAMQGLHRVIHGQLPELFIQPLTFLILIVISYIILHKQLNALWIMSMHAITVFVAFLLSIYLFYIVTPKEIKNVTPEYNGKIWLYSGFSMMFMGLLTVINSRADILMLGAITGNEDVGIYNIVYRGGELVVFIMMAVHISLGPTISQLYSKKDNQRLQKVITKSNHIIFFSSLPIALGLSIFSYWFLLIFGDEFTRGQLALVITCAGKMFHILMGPVSLLLIMTHHERDVLIGMAISAVINILLNALLIPYWGLEGAAAATAVSTVIWCILLSILVYKKTRIYSPVF